MLARYVARDLTRNPRRTASALVGVVLGVGLFSGVLFFIDGSGASMTKRALAPLALDLQRVLGSSSAGGQLAFVEHLSPAAPIQAGGRVTVTLLVRNRSPVTAREVVIDDVAPAHLRYLPGTTLVDNRRVPDPRSGMPLSEGLARLGLNIGAVAPGASRTISYTATADAQIDTRLASIHGRISSRESRVPVPANAASDLSLEALAAKVRAIPGVAAADPLAFVDLPPGTISVGFRALADSARVFAFDEAYRRHYPSVALAGGALRPGSAALSVEAARELGAKLGDGIRIRLPAGPRLAAGLGALTDLSRARPLFYSRRASDFEAFLYIPHTLVVDRAAFTKQIIPAFQLAQAARNRATRTQPVQELDIRLDRSRLKADPGTALAQTRQIASAIAQLSPRGSYAIDNASNALAVARGDAAVAKRMFLFLGLPGALLAAFLAAYAGSVLASAQRREQALLRIRGAHAGHLLQMHLLRTLVLAGAGSAAGVVLGLGSVLAILGPSDLLETSLGQLALTGAISVLVGMLTTGAALYLPGRRALRREINHERAEIELGRPPAWRRFRLDLALLSVTLAGEALAVRSGAFDAPAGSVYDGRSVSLPSYLLLAPLGVWIAGMMLSVRLFGTLAARARLPHRSPFGLPVRGVLLRSVRRRSWSLAAGVAAVGLVVAFGTSLVTFTNTYDAGKAADARFTLGSDLRVTPSVLSTQPHPPEYGAQLRVPGVADLTPVVYKPQNAVLTTQFNEDQKTLAALDPLSFQRVAALPDQGHRPGSPASALSALQRKPDGLLVNSTTAEDLKVSVGDQVSVVLARGTPNQTQVKLRVVGLFRRLPGFPDGVDLIADLSRYNTATHTTQTTFFLGRASQPGAGLAAAAGALQRGPGSRDHLNIETSGTTLDKNQSSLTALNVRGLVELNTLYTLLMAAAGIAIFVFGMMLSRRREYVTLRAQGLQLRELRALVLGEAGLVTGYGVLAGVLVGTVMGNLLVRVLQPLFVLGRGASTSALEVAALVGLVLVAAAASALAATELLKRLSPTELLRET